MAEEFQDAKRRSQLGVTAERPSLGMETVRVNPDGRSIPSLLALLNAYLPPTTL
jgi:hypothetical protein